MNRSEPNSGKVWLAGAGPGDAGLLTVKAKEAMDQADVIVYDALVSLEILSQIPGGCRLIDVGKRSGHHPVRQEEINRILLEEAGKGYRVLRLKGGDPFLFGRGGEELESLKEAQIPYEVIPGVTSVTAVPAYAGIPVTHRDLTSSLHIVTGHARKDGTSRINYPALAAMDATLVFLMGIGAMDEIVNGLQEAGMSGDTPAAVLEKGTTAGQRRVTSTLARLCRDAGAADIGTPAIILVGQVCLLGEAFQWAEKRVLGGRQILITRPRQRASKLGGSLRGLGAQVIELPAISTAMIFPNADFGKVMENFADKGEEAWLVFTSPAGVQVFFELLERMNLDIRWLWRRRVPVKLAAIGSATARELRQFGLAADLVPHQYCAAELGKALALSVKAGSQIVIVRAREGSEQLIPPLYEQGLQVIDVPIYETVYEGHEQIKELVVKAFGGGEIDAVTFTSASTVHGFVKTIKDIDYTAVQAVCIGEQTAAAAREYRMNTVISTEATIASIIDKITELYGR